MENDLRYKIRDLAKRIKSYNKYFNLELFLKAFEYALKAHEGQTRKSGEAYIWHPVHVMEILVEYEADEKTILSALLHDIVEDTTITTEQIEETFGEDIANIVDGVTKLGRLHFSSAEEATVENFRKMFLSMAKDIRIIIIKLADRLHNMRTLKYLDDERRKMIARETLDIYAPLSHRLGMSNIKWELEDLCFRYLHEQDYQKLKNEISVKREEREKYVQSFVESVTSLLMEEGIETTVTGRPKHFWSIYNKMIKQRTNIKNLYDLYAIRIIVNTVKDCYTSLGIIHTQFKPIPGRFKDYVAMPKQNMYQSIHTVVIGPEGKPVEVQIRTREMHKVSEFGIAAHWRYKEGKAKDEPFEKKLAWLRELIEWQDDVDNKDYYEHLKIDLFTEEIFVFTPKGDVYELPIGATPLDFAYRVHSEIGHRCIGAKVNTKIVTLQTPLANGDIVEIITSNIPSPKFAWLSIVKTTSARNKIRQWIKKHSPDSSGGASDEEQPGVGVPATPEQKVSRTVEAIQEGKANKPVRRSAGVIVQDGEDVLTYLSRCCNPVPGDDIMGYITRGRGVAVHRQDCPNFKHLLRERLVCVKWDKDYRGSFDLALEIVALDRVGLLNDIVAKIAEMKVNILNGQIRTTTKGKALVSLLLGIVNMDTLDLMITKIKQVEDVLDVRRV